MLDNINNQNLFTNTLDLATVNKVRAAIKSIQSGTPILIVDDEIEGEGDICVAAQTITSDVLNFMVTACRGIVCQPITVEMSVRLNLPIMVPNGGSPSFTITADAIGVGSGTSAHDRALTARTIANPETKAENLIRPGHIFPIVAKPGGVLERAGHTEASTDIVRFSGFTSSSVICEVMEDDGHMARTASLVNFANKHGLPIVTVRDIINFRETVGDDLIVAANYLAEPSVKVSSNGNGKKTIRVY